MGRTSAIDRQVEELLQNGFSEPTACPCASDMVFVRKNDGSYRRYVGCRWLISVTYNDSYSLSYNDIYLRSMNGAVCFSTLDTICHNIRKTVRDKCLYMHQHEKMLDSDGTPNKGIVYIRQVKVEAYLGSYLGDAPN